MESSHGKGERMTGEREEAMQITDQEAQYDASAKRLLAQKYVLAHLLVKTVQGNGYERDHSFN